MKRQTDLEAVILFDGVCNLCNASINFVIDNDADGYFKFASLQSAEAARYISNCVQDRVELAGDTDYDYLSSIILYEGGTCYRESTAVLRIARKLKGAWPMLYAFILIPAPIRNRIYSWVAKNRYRWFGKQDSCRLPTPELRARFLDGLTTPSV